MTENKGSGWTGYKPPVVKHRHHEKKRTAWHWAKSKRDSIYLHLYQVFLTRNRKEFA